jgi:hypothetical protein
MWPILTAEIENGLSAFVSAPELLDSGRHDVEIGKPLCTGFFYTQTAQKHSRLVFSKRFLDNDGHSVSMRAFLAFLRLPPSTLDENGSIVFLLVSCLRII